MCIAIYKPAGITLTREALLNSFNSNRDGAGFAYVKDGEVNIQKGYFDFDRFWTEFQPFQDLQCIIHFRVATHKAVNGRNCHPWRINDDTVFIHNGMISNCGMDDDISDTGNFAKHVMEPMLALAPDFWKISQFKWLVEAAIGSGNKLVFLDKDGEYKIFNESAGYWDNGVWFSNKSYTTYSPSKDFFVTEQQKAVEMERRASMPAVEVEAEVVTEDHVPSSGNLTDHEKTVLQQRLLDQGIEIVDSLEALDARLEELNSPTGAAAKV